MAHLESLQVVVCPRRLETPPENFPTLNLLCHKNQPVVGYVVIREQNDGWILAATVAL